jgi:hypothetical protein
VILLHEVHEVVGAQEEAFEAAFRDGFLGALGGDDDARLLYFLHHAHGTGVSYNVVTLTALRDASAWESLAGRIHTGDLADWARSVDDLRHDVRAKLLTPLPWSPVQEIELASIPTDPGDHEPSVFMEDTVWPYEGQLEEYVERSGAHYAVEMRASAARGGSILEVLASYRTLFGSGLRREILLWQKVVQPKALAPLVSREVPEQYKRPGTWMHDALGVRDRWESKLLRTARWSPWH